jgi:predicted O-methyltransferase YrrM
LARLRRAPRKIKSEIGLRLLRSFWELPPASLPELARADEIDVANVILDDAGVPPFAGSSHHNDLLPILTLARSMQPRTIIELGTSYGNLTANLCRQCCSARVYTVNALPEQQTGEIVTHSPTRDQIGRVYRAHGYSPRVVQILTNTRELDLSLTLRGAPVDLAVIDACHDTDYVIGDFHKVRPFMKRDGLVLFHDTHPSMEGHLRGSYIACMHLRRAGHDIRHIKGTWWGVWRATNN